ncbi:hypothetical protein BBJ28_00018328 [Nothophytophthora sp. Chile5]|nr:hypothetical protein BBJ28_00018328 [Nothophytophthora sp. Chile5]
MGATYCKGSYEEKLIIVPARSNECIEDCRRIGLHPVEGTPSFDGFEERSGYLAPGLCGWYEKPDPEAVERRRQEQEKEKKRLEEQERREQEKRRQEQEKEKKRLEELERLEQEKRRQEEEQRRRLQQQAEKHRQQQVRDHAAIATHELELAATHDAVQQRVQQRTEQVDQFRMGIRQELNASLAETADCRDMTEERDAVAQRRTERLALMAQQAAQLDADRQRQQEERVGTAADAAFQQSQQDVAQALSTHQLSLDALATAMAEHREAEHQRRVNDALTEELERLELEDMRVQVGMHA